MNRRPFLKGKKVRDHHKPSSYSFQCLHLSQSPPSLGPVRELIVLSAINNSHAAQAHTQSAGRNTDRSDTAADGNRKVDGMHNAAAHAGEAGSDHSSSSGGSSSYRRYDFLTGSVHDLLLLQKVSYVLRGRISARAAYPARLVGR